MTFDPSSRADAQTLWNVRSADAMRAYVSAQHRSEATGLRNQRLSELAMALAALNPDAWPGLDPARGAEACLPVLESLMRS
jgi:hypothetical protein